MMELQGHHQGNMPGIQLYGSRCNPYTSPITRIPRPLFLDSLHSRQINAFTRDSFQAWASSNHHIDNSHVSNTYKVTKVMINDNDNVPLPTEPSTKMNKPFIATAAFPDDIPRLVEVEFAAFRNETVNHVLSYRDSSNPEHTARTINFYKHCMQHIRTSALPSQSTNHDPNNNNNHSRKDSIVDLNLITPEPTTPTTIPTTTPTTTPPTTTEVEGYRFRKVLDPQTHEIIAFCKTEITTLTPGDHASPLDVGHENEPQMNRDWFALNERLHRAYCGTRQHLYFGMLATHPAHQHRGAATSLMSELIAEADSLGLEIYCEATRTGRPMYEKYGFLAVQELRFDPGEYGVEFAGLGVEEQTVMVRGALGKDGVRGEVQSWDEVDW